MKTYKVLVAHQSTIPHYRVDFYNSLKTQLGPEVELYVVEERNKEKRAVFFKENVDFNSFDFNVHYTDTIFFRGSKYCIQTFLLSCWKYDLIIAENAINNLSYPLLILYRLIGKKVAFWGHGRDLNNPGDHSIKRKLLEKIKLRLVKIGSGFFAYTRSVVRYLESKNIPSTKICNVQNTIDVLSARKCFMTVKESDVKLSKQLVFTGRLTKSKRIDFLLSAFERIHKIDSSFELIIIGVGSDEIEKKINDLSERLPIKPLGYVTDHHRLAEIYKDCDLYIYPGYVGLGVLHAMCFDLVPVVIDGEWHKPEFDYLSEENSFILDQSVDEKTYADFILSLYEKPSVLIAKKKNVWKTISSLTVENMAINFARGIKAILDK